MKHIILLGILTFLGCADDADKNQGDTPTGDMGVDTEADMNMADMDHDSPVDTGPTEPFNEKILCKIEIDMMGDDDGEFDFVSYSVYDDVGQIQTRYDVNGDSYYQVDFRWEDGKFMGSELSEDGGMPYAESILTYDDLDRIIVYEDYRNGELQSRVELTHDGMEETAYHDNNGDGVIEYETTYVHLRDVGFFDSYVFSYYERREANGLVSERITQTYDDQERLLTSFLTTPESSELTTYTYEDDLHTVEIDLDNDGTPDETKTWTYDELGAVEHRHVNSDGELLAHYTYENSPDGLVTTVRADEDGDGDLDQVQVQTHGLGSCPEPPEL